MKRFHPTFAFACLALAPALVACNGSSDTRDLGPPLDLGSDGTVADAGTMPDLGHDAGTPDAGPAPIDAGSTAADQTAAEAAATTADCNCDYMGEYATLSDCVAVRTGSPLYASCLASAVTGSDPNVGCEAAAAAAYATCMAGASCADPAAMDCYNQRQNAQMACPALAMSEGMALDTCISTMIVGTGADTCSTTGTPSSATGVDAFTGTTVGAGDHREGMCAVGQTGEGGAPDVTIAWMAPAAGTYTITTDGTLFDTILYVLDGCGASAATLACDDDADGSTAGGPDGLGWRSSVDLTVTAGQVVYIVVDGYNAIDAGMYHVNITGGPALDGGTTTTDAGGASDAGAAPDA